MKPAHLLILGIIGTVLLRSNKESFTIPEIPIKYSCNNVKLLANDDVIRKYLTKFKDEYFNEFRSTELHEVDFIKFTGFMINKLDKNCYIKFVNNEMTPDQGILIYTLLSYFGIYISIFEKFSTGADLESAENLLPIFKDKKKSIRDFFKLGNEEDTDFKIIFKNIILSFEKNRAYDIL